MGELVLAAHGYQRHRPTAQIKGKQGAMKGDHDEMI